MISAHIPTAATTSASLLYGLIGIYVALASIGLLYWLDRRMRKNEADKMIRRPSSVVTSTDLASTKRMERELGEVAESLNGLRTELVCWRDATGQSAADIKLISIELDSIGSRLAALEWQANATETDSTVNAEPSVLSIFGPMTDNNAAGDNNAADGYNAADAEDSADATDFPVAPLGSRDDRDRGWVYDQAPEVADDLTQIWGIGPGYEKRLQESGVYQFSQIASWSDDTIDYFDNLFSFKGRIRRENWVDQAARLGESGKIGQAKAA